MIKQLKIYFTSDVHGCVYPTDYTDDIIKPMGLLAINDSITKDENTLLIDGGDTIQGGPFTTFAENEFRHKPTTTHLIGEVMNTLDYDYVTLGNHDFNYGYDYLKAYMGTIHAKVLCSNVKDTSNQMPIKNYDIRVMPNGLKVGLIGFTTDFINIWEQESHLRNFEIIPPMEGVKALIEEIKPQCDLLIGLYHGGFEYDIHSHSKLSKTTENIAYTVCKELSFDLLLTGHQHIPMCNHDLFGTHIVQTPMNGTKYGFIHINFDDFTKETIITSELLQPNTLESLDNLPWSDLQAKVQQWLDIEVGHLNQALVPKAHIEMALEGSSIANFLNQVQLDASHGQISCNSLANTVFGLNTKVTLRDIVSTYIYPNTIVSLKVTGKILKQALERSASYFALKDGVVTVSDQFMKPKVEHYNYDYFSGIDYTIDIRKDVGQRIVKLQFNGKDVSDKDEFTLVMNNYRSSGAGGYEFYADCDVVEDIQISTPDMIANYIKKHPVVTIDTKKYFSVLY